MNKVVARFADGRVIKGITADFFQNKEIFHLRPANAAEADKPMEISTKELKALFFVRDYQGQPQHVEKKEFDPAQPEAEAIAINGDRIVAVGSTAEIRALAGTTTPIDLGGRFVVPGFTDTHVHFLDGGFRLSSVQLRDARTREEFVSRIKAFAATVAISVKVLPSVLRSIRTPASTAEASVQVRSTSVPLWATAVSPLGASGRGTAKVVALASFE